MMSLSFAVKYHFYGLLTNNKWMVSHLFNVYAEMCMSNSAQNEVTAKLWHQKAIHKLNEFEFLVVLHVFAFCPQQLVQMD